MSNQVGGNWRRSDYSSNYSPNVTFLERDPTIYDVQNYKVGDEIINTITLSWWKLVAAAGNSMSAGPLATWVEVNSSISTISIAGDTGIATGNPISIQTQFNGTTKFVASGSSLLLSFEDTHSNMIINDVNGTVYAGNNNTAFGHDTLPDVTGSNNAVFGTQAGSEIISGNNNAIFGVGAFTSVTHGSDNTIIGTNAGSSYNIGSESSNILIGNTGVNGESNVIRVGTQGSGAAQQNQAFFAGIYGVVPSGSLQTVTINSSGQLGSTASIPTNSFNTINIQTFTASGTYTPTANMQYCLIEVIGGGGGAGGVDTTTTGNCGAAAGGGGGGYSRGFFSAATIGASQTVTVGAGGAGASGTGNGSVGGTTSVGALISATGGNGGGHANVGTLGLVIGTTGGIGSSGQVNSMGSPSGTSWFQFISASSQYLVFSGYGGSSVLGGGGQPTGAGSAGSGQINGSNGTAYGGGGAGGIAFGTSSGATGGNGSDGVVIITEFIS